MDSYEHLVKVRLQNFNMGQLNRYLFKKAAISIGGLVVFACCVLLLERLLRIFEVVTTSTNPASDASTMIINLLPYYLGIAVPMALLLGIIITVDRFSRSSELTAALGAGISLTHMTKPFVYLAVMLAIFTIFIEGILQPVGRYNYRKVENTIKQTAFTAALREGTFTQVGDRTFFAGTDLPGAAIGPIFIYEQVMTKKDQTGFRITTANQGQLIVKEETNEPVLQLSEGRGFQIIDNAQLGGNIRFGGSTIAGAATVKKFRPRGDDEREMTSMELYKNQNGENFPEVDKNANNATLHLRIAKSVVLLILPFIAVPFGLNYGRNPSSAGIFVGVVFLVSLQKALDFAQSMGASGKIPPWAGIWGIVLAVALFAFYIFRKSAFKMGQPPLTSVSHWITHVTGKARGFFAKLSPTSERIENV